MLEYTNKVTFSVVMFYNSRLDRADEPIRVTSDLYATLKLIDTRYKTYKSVVEYK